MKSSEFNKQFEIDRSKNGLKAIEKVKLPKRRKVNIWTTSDGKVYDPTKTYYFFDSKGITKEVRTNQGLKADPETGDLDSLGYRVVAISKLHISEAEALEDGIKHYYGIIKDVEKEISKLNNRKVNHES